MSRPDPLDANAPTERKLEDQPALYERLELLFLTNGGTLSFEAVDAALGAEADLALDILWDCGRLDVLASGHWALRSLATLATIEIREAA